VTTVAEILVKMGPEAKDLTSWGRLLPVTVKPDGWQWGRLETWPDFVVVAVPDMPMEDAEDLLDPVIDPLDPTEKTVLVLRRWRINLDHVALPANIRNRLADGRVVVSRAQIQPFLKEAI
jgi:hypothetical protein